MTTDGQDGTRSAAGPPRRSNDLWWIAGLLSLAVLGAGSAWLYAQNPAPETPIYPGNAGATPGTEGATGGVLKYIGVPQSGPGSELNGVIAVLVLAGWLLFAIAVFWFSWRGFPPEPTLAGLSKQVGRAGYVTIAFVAGVLASIFAYRSGGSQALLATVSAALFGIFVIPAVTPSAHGSNATIGLVARAVQILLFSVVAAAILILIFPSTFG